jgi:hypothetical protein
VISYPEIPTELLMEAVSIIRPEDLTAGPATVAATLGIGQPAKQSPIQSNPVFYSVVDDCATRSNRCGGNPRNRIANTRYFKVDSFR